MENKKLLHPETLSDVELRNILESVSIHVNRRIAHKSLK